MSVSNEIILVQMSVSNEIISPTLRPAIRRRVSSANSV